MKDVNECCFPECSLESIAMIGNGPYDVTYACKAHINELRDLLRDWMQIDGVYFAPGVQA